MNVMWLVVGIFALGIVYEGWIAGRIGEHPCMRGRLQALKRVRPTLYRLAAGFLLLRIGFMGGAALAQPSPDKSIESGLLAVGLALTVCLIALFYLKWTTRFAHDLRVVLATHFGSISVGTFAAAIAFLDSHAISYSPMASAWVALMELPALVVGAVLLGQGLSAVLSTLREEPSLLILPLALVVGLVAGAQLLEIGAVRWVMEHWFEPVLLYFLFEVGRQAFYHLRQLGSERAQMVNFGLVMPLLGGTLGAAVARLAGLDEGDAMLLATLCASASYVAAPIAMQGALTARYRGDADAAQSAIASGLAVALGITLPFNLLIGIRVYTWEAQSFALPLPAILAVAALVCFLFVAARQRLIISRIKSVWRTAQTRLVWKKRTRYNFITRRQT